MNARDPELERALALQVRLDGGDDGDPAGSALSPRDATRAEELDALVELAGELRGLALPELPERDLRGIEAALWHAAEGPRLRLGSGSAWLIALLALGLLGWLGFRSLPGGPAQPAPAPGRTTAAPPTAIAAGPLPSAERPARPTLVPTTPTTDAAAAELGRRLLAELEATATARASGAAAAPDRAGPRAPARTPLAAAATSPPSPSATARPAAPVGPEPATRAPRPTGTAIVLVATEPPSATPVSAVSPSPEVSPTLTPSAEPTPSGEALLEVLLRDAESGEPLPEIGVSALRVDGGPPLRARSGERGGARFVLVAGAAYLVVAEGDRHRPRWWPDAATREDAEAIVLAPGAAREIELRLPRREPAPSPDVQARGALR